MLLSPIQNTAVFNKSWFQKRPRITQLFGKNPHIYKPMGAKAHTGIDFGVPIGTPIFAPCDGEIRIKNDPGGYGKHIKLRSKHGLKEIVLAHFDRFGQLANGQEVFMGQLLGWSGNTGFSTGPHLHFGMRRLNRGNGEDIWGWGIENYKNGYFGYINLIDYVITWKGTLDSFSV